MAVRFVGLVFGCGAFVEIVGPGEGAPRAAQSLRGARLVGKRNGKDSDHVAEKLLRAGFDQFNLIARNGFRAFGERFADPFVEPGGPPEAVADFMSDDRLFCKVEGQACAFDGPGEAGVLRGKDDGSQGALLAVKLPVGAFDDGGGERREGGCAGSAVQFWPAGLGNGRGAERVRQRLVAERKIESPEQLAHNGFRKPHKARRDVGEGDAVERFAVEAFGCQFLNGARGAGFVDVGELADGILDFEQARPSDGEFDKTAVDRLGSLGLVVGFVGG